MKEAKNPQEFATKLIRTNGAYDALRIAQNCFLSTQGTQLAEYDKRKDPRVERVLQNRQLRVGRFWNNVFGILLKKIHPGVSRKEYLSGSAKGKSQ